jgi:hypothetical protein
MTEKTYGPHPAALDAIDRFYAGDENKLRRGIARNGALIAHDPALGLDRSVCLRDVLLWLRETSDPDAPYDAYCNIAADLIEREFGAGNAR